MLWGEEAQQRLARSHVILFGLGGVVVCAACAALAARRARKEFGGFNGDQAGCLLQTCELALLALFVVVQKAGLI